MSAGIFLCVGSRGDIEPPLALANELHAAGILDTAYVYLPTEFQYLLGDAGGHEEERKGNTFMHAMDSELISLRSFGVAVRKVADPLALKRDRVRTQLHACGAIVEHCVNPLTQKVLEDCQHVNPVLLITTTLGTTLARTVSDVLNIPSIVLHMQPNTPSAAFPCYLSSQKNSRDAARSIAPVYLGERDYEYSADNKESYDVFASGMFAGSLPGLNDIRKGMDLCGLELDDVVSLFRGEYENVYVIQSYLDIIPRPYDVSRHIGITPPLAPDFVRPSWSPETHCPDLLKYMEGGEAPFAMSVGVGVSLGDETRAVTLAVVSAFASAKVNRVIILGNAIRPDLLSNEVLNDSGVMINAKEWACKHMYVCREDVQFAWLFPKCSGIVTHGGAGTVSTALTAAIPVAILPHAVDQFFWAELIAGIGLGANVSKPLVECSKEDIANAITTIRKDDVRNRVRDFAQKQRRQSSSGCKQAAKWILDNIISPK